MSVITKSAFIKTVRKRIRPIPLQDSAVIQTLGSLGPPRFELEAMQTNQKPPARLSIDLCCRPPQVIADYLDQDVKICLSNNILRSSRISFDPILCLQIQIMTLKVLF